MDNEAAVAEIERVAGQLDVVVANAGKPQPFDVGVPKYLCIANICFSASFLQELART